MMGTFNKLTNRKAHRLARSDGFAAVEAVLIVVVLAVIGGIGWFVYHHKMNTTKTNDTTSSQSAVATSATSYLAVDAWGVKLPNVTSGQYKLVIPSKVNGGGDNPSVPSMDNPSGNLQDLWLEASGLTTAETQCSADTTGYQSVGSIFRDTTLQTNSDVAKLPSKKVGDYYYFLQVGYGANCIAQPTTGQQAFLDAITKSFNQLQLN